MKINISSEELSGYQNIGFKLNLDGVCANGEADEIIAYIDYIPANKFSDFLSHLSGKMAIDGKLIIYGTDVIEVCNNILSRKISQEESIKTIYGDTSKPPKKMMISLDMLVSAVEALGLKILKKRLDSTEMVVEAVRC